MSAPIDVQIVVPRMSTRSAWVITAGQFIAYAMRTWLVMLLFPAVFGFGISFWKAAAGVLLVSLLLGTQSGEYKVWTKRATS